MENKYFGFIYETTNILNQKKYIGKCIFSRKNDWNKYLGSGTYLKRAMKKYGKENFKRKILFLAMNEKELNELEETIIDLFDVVKSKQYYNLKRTSIGGDVFTDNPRKEIIREMRREQMSGKGNHQYGKQKTDKMIASVKEANSKKIIVDGVYYESITDCHNKTGVSISTIHYRLNSDGFANYHYIRLSEDIKCQTTIETAS